MPYLGGLTWSDVLATLNNLPLDHRSGRDIVSALDADEAGSPVNASRSGAARGFLARSAYTQAVCWIAACLADALQHAHDRGLVHLDIKPSNILLAGDGQPMLLDFHLAREILPAGSQPPSRLGGTRGYMSPEQQLAAEAVRDGRPLSMDLDGRSDVYSLGATLYESLTARLPPGDEAASRRYWRRSATSASRGLEDIVHKCLARNRPIATPMPRGSRRICADIGGLAAGRRAKSQCPRTLAKMAPTKALRLGGSRRSAGRPDGCLGHVNVSTQRPDECRAGGDLAGNASIHTRDFSAAVEQLERGRNSLRWLPGQGDLKTAIEAKMEVARRGRVADAVHDLTEQLRYLDGNDNVSVATLRQLDGACAKLWNVRGKLAPLATADANSAERTVFCART